VSYRAKLHKIHHWEVRKALFVCNVKDCLCVLEYALDDVQESRLLKQGFHFRLDLGGILGVAPCSSISMRMRSAS